MTEPSSKDADRRRLFRTILAARDETAGELAARARIDPAELSRLENGRRKITARVAERLGRAIFLDDAAAEAE